MKLTIIAPDEIGAQGMLGRLPGTVEAVHADGTGMDALHRAAQGDADYILKVLDPAVSTGELEQALEMAGENDLVIGRGRHNGLSGFSMRLVYTYSFRIFFKCGVPSFLLIRRENLAEYLENSPPDFACPEAVLIASACYAHASVGTVECAGAGGCAAGTAGRVFGHVFHSLKTFRQLDLRLRSRYGAYKPAQADRRGMGPVDKLLSLAHREMITYLIFGVLTTIVNYVVYWLCTLALTPDIFLRDKNYLISNAISWIVAVAFAYVTNKLFVFDSRSWKPALVAREVVAFVGARLLSLVFDMGIMYVCVSLIGINEFIAKLISQIVVVIVNYVFSKLFIFRKK